MIRWILVACGLAAVSVGTWRGYANARDALVPVSGESEPTRRAVEDGQRLLARPRIRRFIRAAAIAILWIVIAMYGLLLIATAGSLPGALA